MPRHVYIGGTFDHLHAGHMAFIKSAAALGDVLHIGITSPELITEKYLSEQIQSLQDRTQAVAEYCAKRNIQVELETLTDPSGSAHTADATEAVLCVTTATALGGTALNERRVAAGREALPMTVVPLIPAADGAPIASARIRAGQISRDGEVFESVFEKNITLTDSQRQALQTLKGEAVTEVSAGKNYLVGDVVTQTSIDNSWQYNLAVIDGYSERRELSELPVAAEEIALTAVNPAGQITTHLAQTLRTALKQRSQHVFVQGEEDLAAVVLSLLLPLQSNLYFGIAGDGMRHVVVTEQLKLMLYGLLRAKV